MSNILSAIKQVEVERPDSLTANAGATFSTSLSKCVDYFFLAGSSRGKDITSSFLAALNENEEIAIRTMLWMRDCRGGAGERALYHQHLKALIDINPKAASGCLIITPEIGRWDDVIEIGLKTHLQDLAIALVIDAINNKKNKLAAKWMPRKGTLANTIRQALEMTPKQYRKWLVSNTSVVETPMCANTWGKINYKQVPSIAASRYSKAFTKHDSERYDKYLADLETGKTTVNAEAIYPYMVIQNLTNGNPKLAEEQWKALPDYVSGNDKNHNFIVVADTSGSMSSSVGNNKNIRMIDVCLSLAIYISERTTGIAKDHFITFSSKPKLQSISGSLSNKVNQLIASDWAMNTNLEAVFNLLLEAGTSARLSQDKMPSHILIISDMEFDSCCRSDKTVFQVAKKEFEQAGYQMPAVIFWNLNGKQGNVPVRATTPNTALISGFSPAIMKSILATPDKLDPVSLMVNTVMNPRYNYLPNP